ncbi:MAG: hypothetical protein LBG64_01880 [Pseudomonadales bacterium]|jgi:hypothetical protein|nr:hypothetical protein [Pseudomonadales bacterium]
MSETYRPSPLEVIGKDSLRALNEKLGDNADEIKNYVFTAGSGESVYDIWQRALSDASKKFKVENGKIVPATGGEVIKKSTIDAVVGELDGLNSNIEGIEEQIRKAENGEVGTFDDELDSSSPINIPELKARVETLKKEREYWQTLRDVLSALNDGVKASLDAFKENTRAYDFYRQAREKIAESGNIDEEFFAEKSKIDGESLENVSNYLQMLENGGAAGDTPDKIIKKCGKYIQKISEKVAALEGAHFSAKDQIDVLKQDLNSESDPVIQEALNATIQDFAHNVFVYEAEAKVWDKYLKGFENLAEGLRGSGDDENNSASGNTGEDEQSRREQDSRETSRENGGYIIEEVPANFKDSQEILNFIGRIEEFVEVVGIDKDEIVAVRVNMENADIGPEDIVDAKVFLSHAKRLIESWINQTLLRLEATQILVGSDDDESDVMIMELKTKLDHLSKNGVFDTSIFSEVSAIEEKLIEAKKNSGVGNSGILNALLEQKVNNPHEVNKTTLDAYLRLITIDGKTRAVFVDEQIASGRSDNVKNILRGLYDVSGIIMDLSSKAIAKIKEDVDGKINEIEDGLRSHGSGGDGSGDLNDGQAAALNKYIAEFLTPLSGVLEQKLEEERTAEEKRKESAKNAREKFEKAGFDYLFQSESDRLQDIKRLRGEIESDEERLRNMEGLEGQEGAADLKRDLEDKIKANKERLANLELVRDIAEQYRALALLYAIDSKNDLFTAAMMDDKSPDTIVSQIKKLKEQLKEGSLKDKGFDDHDFDNVAITLDRLVSGFSLDNKTGKASKIYDNNPGVVTIKSIELQLKSIRDSVNEPNMKGLIDRYASKSLDSIFGDVFTRTGVEANGGKYMDRAVLKGWKMRMANIDHSGARNDGQATSLLEAAELLEKNYARYDLGNTLFDLMECGFDVKSMDGAGRYVKPEKFAEILNGIGVSQRILTDYMNSYHVLGGVDAGMLNLNDRFSEVDDETGEKKHSGGGAVVNNITALVRAYLSMPREDGSYFFSADRGADDIAKTFNELFGDSVNRKYIAKGELTEDDKQELRDAGKGGQIEDIEKAIRLFKELRDNLINEYDDKATIAEEEQREIDEIKRLREENLDQIEIWEARLAEIDIEIYNEVKVIEEEYGLGSLSLLRKIGSARQERRREEGWNKIDAVYASYKGEQNRLKAELAKYEIPAPRHRISDVEKLVGSQIKNIQEQVFDFYENGDPEELELYMLVARRFHAPLTGVFRDAHEAAMRGKAGVYYFQDSHWINDKGAGTRGALLYRLGKGTAVNDINAYEAIAIVNEPFHRNADVKEASRSMGKGGVKSERGRRGEELFYVSHEDENGDEQKKYLKTENVGGEIRPVKENRGGQEVYVEIEKESLHSYSVESQNVRFADIRVSADGERINYYLKDSDGHLVEVNTKMNNDSVVPDGETDDEGNFYYTRVDNGERLYESDIDVDQTSKTYVKHNSASGKYEFFVSERGGTEHKLNVNREASTADLNDSFRFDLGDREVGTILVSDTEGMQGGFANPQADEDGEFGLASGLDKYMFAAQRGHVQLCENSPYWAAFSVGVDENGKQVPTDSDEALYRKFDFSWTPESAHQDNPELDSLLFQSPLLKQKTIAEVTKVKTAFEELRIWSSANIADPLDFSTIGSELIKVGTWVSLVKAMAEPEESAIKDMSPEQAIAVARVQEKWRQDWMYLFDKTTAYIAAKVVRYYSTIKVGSFSLLNADAETVSLTLESIRERYEEQQNVLSDTINTALGDTISGGKFEKDGRSTSVENEVRRVNDVCKDIPIDLSSVLLGTERALLEKDALFAYDKILGNSTASKYNVVQSLGNIVASAEKKDK